MDNKQFLNTLYNNITGQLISELPKSNILKVGNDITFEKQLSRVSGYSVIFIFSLFQNNGQIIELVSKSHKKRDIQNLEEAINASENREIAKREFQISQEVFNIFKNKNNLKIPVPLFFFDDINTIIYTKAEGGDFAEYINKFEFSLAISKKNREHITKIITYIAQWISHFHSNFAQESKILNINDLLSEIIFNYERLQEFKNIPFNKIEEIHQQLLQKSFNNKIEIPCAGLHGDYKFRHIWNEGSEAITVFDFGNEMQNTFIYEDLAGFITESILLDFGVNFNKINSLSQIIERTFIKEYKLDIDRRILNIFIIKYLIKKWDKRKLRLYRFLKNNFKTKNIFLLTKLVEIYIDHYFIKKIKQRIVSI